MLEKSLALATRIAAVEAVVERGHSQIEVAKDLNEWSSLISQWVQSHYTGTTTLTEMRVACDKAAPPSYTLRVVPKSKDALLQETAGHVLAENAPVEHFYWWLRFFVREWGM